MAPHPRLAVAVLLLLLQFKSIGCAPQKQGPGGVSSHPATDGPADEWITIPVHGAGTSSRIPTPLSPDGPFQVLVDASVLDIEKIDGTFQEMAVHVQLRQYWTDSALESFEVLARTDTGFTNSSSPIWTPDTVIANQRYGHGRNHENQNHFVLKYNTKTGELEKSERIFTVIKCESMDFTRYPFDYHMCTLHLRSAIFSSHQQLQYKWSRNHGDDGGNGTSWRDLDYRAIKPYHIVSPFQVVQISMHQASDLSVGAMRKAGSQSQISLGIEVRRLWPAYIHRFYLPMTTFVATSLLSLWLVHPKISFVMNFINIVSMNIFLAIWDLHSDIPKLAYCTALDAYAIICYLFIVLILMLNVYILFYIKSDDNDSDDGQHNQSFQSSQEQKYFLPKQDVSRSFRMRHPHPFQRTIHSRSDGSSPTPNAGNGSGGLESCGPAPHQPVEIAESPVEVVSRRASATRTSWSCVKEKFLDTIRRSGHTLFLFTFIAIFLLYWVILLSLYYS